MVALMTMPALSGGASKKKNISPSELSQRVAVIKRFKELLQSQRDRFNEYLNALDKQKDVILKGTAEDLLRHVELEEKIVADIFSIQKVIDPLEEMYHSVRLEFPAEKSPKPAGPKKEEKTSGGGEEIISLKEALDGLKAEAVIRSERNKELLAKRMAELRSEIKSLRSSAYARRRFDIGNTPSLVDIKG